MAFFDGMGNQLEAAGSGSSGYSVTNGNIWTGENDLKGYALGNYDATAMTASEGSNVAVVPLKTGHTYWIAAVNSTGADIYSLPLDEDNKAQSGGTHFAKGIWATVYKYINGNGTIGSEQSWKFTPDQDWYLYAQYDAETGFVVVTEQEGILPDTPDVNLFSAVTRPLFGFDASGSVVAIPWYSTPNVGMAVSVEENMKLSVRKSITPAEDLQDSNIAGFWIGDSILYAASNAGIAAAYRKEITYKFGIRHGYCAVAGICATDGYGLSWDSSDSTQTGVSGFMNKLDVADEFQDTEKFKNCQFAVLALGTNDFGNNAPLGTLGNGDTTTFYGAYQQYIEHIRAQNPTIPIIIIVPFKRENWNVANEQGLTLTDYCYAIRDIAFQYKSIYILDLFDKWYLDYDNENIRADFFLDYGHPSGKAHRMISNELAELIPYVLLMEGTVSQKRS